MENLRKIIEKKTLSKADKMLVLEMAQYNEFAYNDFNPACGDCYKDLAILLLQHLEQTEAQALEPAEEKRKILIKKGVDIIVNGARVNRQTIKTDEQAKQLLELGLSLKYFEIKEDAN